MAKTTTTTFIVKVPEAKAPTIVPMDKTNPYKQESDYVGGYLTVVPNIPRFTKSRGASVFCLVDEEGELKANLTPNLRISLLTGLFIVGKGVFSKFNSKGVEIGLTLKEAEGIVTALTDGLRMK